MTTAIDDDLRPEAETSVALLDHPQPLGVLPTRRFWRDPENQRLVRLPHAILVGVFLFAINLLIGMLELPWWVAGLAAGLADVACIVLMQGLFERYIRRAAMRRFRSRPEPPALTEAGVGDEASDLP